MFFLINPIFLWIRAAADGSNLIKKTLIEIMKTTCIKFASRLISESDYVVFMEYKNPVQDKGFDIIICFNIYKGDQGYMSKWSHSQFVWQ